MGKPSLPGGMVAMITVVCVYNDKKTMSDCLLRGLKAQAAKHELIALDNTKGRFKSAAEALNYGGNKARGKYVMFVHQDVSLPSPNMLGEIEKTLDGLPNLGIAGAAGISGETGHVASNIMHGKPPWTAGKLRIKAPMKMQTLDECLLLVPRSVFKTLKFDEQVCNDWHLYAVD
ncbi:MAG: glycosyltransferase, partial [Candidatus Micrarchaeia archaeon]